jgi:hypothetical protein
MLLLMCLFAAGNLSAAQHSASTGTRRNPLPKWSILLSIENWFGSCLLSCGSVTAAAYFPIQNRLNICSKISAVCTVPLMRPR